MDLRQPNRLLPAAAALFLCLSLSAGCATGPAPAGEAAPAAPRTEPVLTPAEKNPRAPDVSFLDMEGKESPLSSFKGKEVVLVNFWGVRCQNCIEEMPFLERLYHKYGGKGLLILGVNTDGIDANTIRNFLPQLPKVSYNIIVDADFKLGDAFQMTAAPLTLLIAKDGTIRYRHEGYDPSVEQEYIDLIDKLLVE